MSARDLSKVTHVDGVDYCDECGYVIDGFGMCNPPCTQFRAALMGAKEMQRREPLVLEVIRLSKALEVMNRGNSTYPDWTAAQIELEKACRKLAEFRP